VVRYVARRLVQTVVMLWGLTLILFTLLHLAPGSAVDYLIPQNVVDPGQRGRLIHQLGLDKTPPEQYWRWLEQLLHGNFGTAYTYGESVISVIDSRLWPTLELQSVVIILSIIIAIPAGVIAAVRRYTFTDHTVTSASLFGLSMPSFWFALMLILLFSVRLNWLPVSGNGIGSAWGNWNYFVLPVVVLSLALVPWYARFVRASMIETLQQDYILTARAFGVPETRINFRNALKPSLLPVLTIIGLSLPRLIGGSVIVETIFAWPGLGRLAYDSIERHDFPVVMTLGLLTGAFVMIANLLIDLLYVAVDPRVVLD
jgi:ABC-type dipeptide/oligopeptide/nickel transport system permease component